MLKYFCHIFSLTFIVCCLNLAGIRDAKSMLPEETLKTSLPRKSTFWKRSIENKERAYLGLYSPSLRKKIFSQTLVTFADLIKNKFFLKLEGQHSNWLMKTLGNMLSLFKKTDNPQSASSFPIEPSVVPSPIAPSPIEPSPIEPSPIEPSVVSSPVRTLKFSSVLSLKPSIASYPIALIKIDSFPISEEQGRSWRNRFDQFREEHPYVVPGMVGAGCVAAAYVTYKTVKNWGKGPPLLRTPI